MRWRLPNTGQGRGQKLDDRKSKRYSVVTRLGEEDGNVGGVRKSVKLNRLMRLDQP